MNNLEETVWHENPVILGAIAGSGKFDLKSKDGRMSMLLYLHGLSGEDTISTELMDEDNNFFSVNVKDCVLLTRSIDSLTDEELLEAESTFNIPSYKSVTKWLMDNKERLDVFIWLLSKGIWTGSKEGVEVIDG